MRISLPMYELTDQQHMGGGYANFRTRVTVTCQDSDDVTRVTVSAGMSQQAWEAAGRPTSLDVELPG